MAGIDSLDSLFRAQLKGIYDAEKQITKALPKIIKKASSDELRTAFEEHLRQTEQQIERLEEVFEQLGMPVRGQKCIGMQNLLEEGSERMAEAEDDDTRDALMIASAQKVEHYEIATYGTLRLWAKVLGYADAVALFERTLEEEKKTDQRLTAIARAFVNEAAADKEGDLEEAENKPAPSLRRMLARGATGTASHAAADRGRSSAKGKGRSR